MFFETYGWTPEILLERTMRELVAYSKQMRISERARTKLQAALHDKQIELPGEQGADAPPAVVDRVREIEKKIAERHGFKS
jgi:hypothetical protein